MIRLLLVVLAALAVAAPALAIPGTVAIGLAPGASPEKVARAVEAATGGRVVRRLGSLRSLVLATRDVGAAAAAALALPGVDFAEPTGLRRSLDFVPNDPLLPGQWYVPAIRAFDFWPEKPVLGAPVLVAVVDSGVDGTHPDLQGRILEAKTFVQSEATVDTIGHGTMVAGEIAAALDNGVGIAGIAFPAQLLIAKVVDDEGEISLEAEARAIRWAVDRGARVVNLSLGGPRNPDDPERDTYSELEQRAIDYAVRKGAVVVAATGNCQELCPYKYASYPAALAHVIGVSALAEGGETPAFSNRDVIHNDIAAPGKGVVSTFPLALSDPACEQPGYSVCATVEDYRRGEGTSFAAPLVSAAAALVLFQRPDLKASQVVDLLERTALDVQDPGRDKQSGNGQLDVAAALAALAGPLPPADTFEPNDDAGSRSYTLWSPSGLRQIEATLDFFEDPTDVYRVRLRKGERAVIRLQGPAGTDANLILWRPGAKSVEVFPPRGLVADVANRPGARELLRYKADEGGWYFLQVKLSRGTGGSYSLSVEKIRPA